MRRLTCLAFLALALAGLPAQAQELCERYKVEQFVDAVPYFSTRMQRAAAAPGTVAYVHPDDSRINVTFRMQVAPDEAPSTRMAYIRDLRERLDREAAKAAPGTEVDKGVFPYDPISWTLQSRTVDGETTDAAGSITVRVAPTCHLVAVWRVMEQPLLTTRIRELTMALEAVRTLSRAHMADQRFLPDSNVPTGARAVLFNLLIPVLASFALMFGLKSMQFLGRPGPIPRVLAGAGAVASAAVLSLQMQDYLDGFVEQRFMDNAGLLFLLVGVLAPAAVLGNQKSVLSGFAVAACGGLALALATLLGWTPSSGPSASLAALLIGISLVGLRVWQVQGTGPQPVRRVARQA